MQLHQNRSLPKPGIGVAEGRLKLHLHRVLAGRKHLAQAWDLKRLKENGRGFNRGGLHEASVER
jgi:hypothetical protein